jgi:signal transduction histidine kinase
MRLLPKEAWHYAYLMVILLALAALAVHHTMSYVIALTPTSAQPAATVAIWSMTLGFMLIAGAFGIWAIQFSAHGESMRRIGQLVDAMDYIEDAIIAINRRGNITGSNPAARKLARLDNFTNITLTTAFPVLSDTDREALTERAESYEIERTFMRDTQPVTYRFRSQPCGNLSLILVSDVTLMHTRRRHARHVARLQLIGQLARGVAHDFNNILCVISGHATLLPRFPPESDVARESIASINRAVEKGTALANQLTALGTSDAGNRTSVRISEHVVSGAELLRNTLATDWTVNTDIHEVPVLAMTGLQMEQIVVNLGLLASDTAPSSSGVLRIILATPEASGPLRADSDFAAVLLISASGSDMPASAQDVTEDRGDRAGAILSIVQTIVEEEGGQLHVMKGQDSAPIFKVFCMPGNLTPEDREAAGIPPELAAYVAQWSVLLAVAGRTGSKLGRVLDRISVHNDRVSDIASALAHIEEAESLDAIIVDEHLLRHEVKGLLRAIHKLRPSAGIIALSESPDSMARQVPAEVVTVALRSSPEALLTAMIRAKSVAASRNRQA